MMSSPFITQQCYQPINKLSNITMLLKSYLLGRYLLKHIFYHNSFAVDTFYFYLLYLDTSSLFPIIINYIFLQ